MILADRRPHTDRGTTDANLNDAACGFRVFVRRIAPLDLTLGHGLATPAEQLRGRDPVAPRHCRNVHVWRKGLFLALVSSGQLRRATAGVLSIRLGTTSSNWKLLSLGTCADIGTHTVIKLTVPIPQSTPSGQTG